MSLATDASQFGWGGILLAQNAQVSDYWSEHEMSWDIATKEAIAIDRVLHAFSTHVMNSHVDVLVDNQAVINAWHIKEAAATP